MAEWSKDKNIFRIVDKRGNRHILRKGLSWYFNFYYLIELHWFKFTIFFFVTYYTSLCFFAFGYLLISLGHHDILSLDGTVDEHDPSPSCFKNINTFGEAYALSLETQTTIGYGHRYPNDICPDAVLFIMIQIMWSYFVYVIFVSMIFTRISSPCKRDESICFSENALITLRNGQLYFILRVYDIYDTRSDRGADVEAFCIKSIEERVEGNCIQLDIKEMAVGYSLDGKHSNIPLMWPTEVSHLIDVSSPLYNMDPDQLAKSNLEIIVWLDGTHSENSTAINIRTSYRADEIIWGARFSQNLALSRRRVGNILNFDWEDVNSWEMDNRTPRISAKQKENWEGMDLFL